MFSTTNRTVSPAVVLSETVLQPRTTQAAAALQLAVNQVANQNGIIDVRGEGEIEIQPYVKTTKVKCVNPDTAKAQDGVVYIFNESIFNNTVDANAANYAVDADPSDKISVTYNDGFKGRSIDELLKTVNGGRGLQCDELTIMGFDEDGNPSDEVIEDLDFTIQAYNPVSGKPMPYSFDPSEALRNTANKNGMVTLKTNFWINRLSQITFDLKKGQTVQLRFKWVKQSIR
jgi:hypothetical protein